MKERFEKIQQKDNLLNLSYGESLLNFPQAKSYVGMMRNRYPDVLPTPLNLVTIKHPTTGETDYINASQFENTILTQGPFIHLKADTVADFWMMAFEQGTHIVCLTDHMGISQKELIEKTFPYWDPRLADRLPDPSQPHLIFRKKVGPLGNEAVLEVRLVAGPDVAVKPNEKGECVTKRTFEIAFGDQLKRVTHLYFEKWKDHSVCDPDQLADLIALVIENPGLTIAHCSAGLGRAGVFAIAKSFIERGLNPGPAEIDAAVLELRKRRPGAVQSSAQLELISKTISAYYAKKVKKAAGV